MVVVLGGTSCLIFVLRVFGYGGFVWWVARLV